MSTVIEIKKSNTAAGYFDTNLSLTNSGNTATGTGLRGFKVTGTLGVDQTWNADTVPYIVSTVTIPSGKTLTINPNAILKFENSSSQISVNGTLDSEGNSLYPVVFTSIADDMLNDTNGTTTPATAGDWTFVLVNSGGTTTLNYSIVRYGGATYNTNIYNNGGVLSIPTSTISNAYLYGIRHEGGTTNVNQSVIRDNGSEGFHNGTTATSTATSNYWGALSGPYNALYNPSGAGNDVTNYVSFNPWLGTSTHYIFNWNSVDYDDDHGKEIRWGGTTKYTTAWNAAIDTWNALRTGTTSGVLIAGDDGDHYEDLTVVDNNYGNTQWAAQYVPNLFGGAEDLKLNEYHLDKSWATLAVQENIIIHELGHALGLAHSYWENAEYFEVTGQTTLGNQDIADYNYCWLDGNCSEY